MVVADLHIHTTNSDGTLDPDAVPAAAREAGLSAVATTDHDRLHPSLDHPAVERGGVTLIHGIELRVEAGLQRVDLLGYGVRRTDALTAEIARIQRDRVERGRAIIENVETHLDRSLPIEAQPGIGRPDIARAVVDAAPEYDDIGAVFDDLIDEAGPCYVARDVPTFERGRELLAEACGVVSLAHPLRYPDPDHALLLASQLDAVEVYYPYDGSRGHRSRDDGAVDRVTRVADDHDLLVTGGSDAHGETLGATGLSQAAYEPVAAAIDP